MPNENKPVYSENRRIVVFGGTAVGKTTFLAAVIDEIEKIDVEEKKTILGPWSVGCSSGRIRKEMCDDVKEKGFDRKKTEATQPGTADKQFKLFFSRAKEMFGQERYTFSCRDVAGEDWRKRAHDPEKKEGIAAKLLIDAKYATGIIFLIDPLLELDDTKWKQGPLLRNFIDNLIEKSGNVAQRKPVLFVLSKADEQDVADKLQMTSLDVRNSAKRNPETYAKITDTQDSACREFLRTRMKDLWQLIDPNEPNRKLPVSHVMAISSLGMPYEKLKHPEAAERWRVLDPFVWIANNSRRWNARNQKKIVTFTFLFILSLLTGFFGVWFYKDFVQVYIEAKNDVDESITQGQFGEATIRIEKWEGADPWFLVSYFADELRETVEKEKALSEVLRKCQKGSYLEAWNYIQTIEGKEIASASNSLLIERVLQWLVESDGPTHTCRYLNELMTKKDKFERILIVIGKYEPESWAIQEKGKWNIKLKLCQLMMRLIKDASEKQLEEVVKGLDHIQLEANSAEYSKSEDFQADFNAIVNSIECQGMERFRDTWNKKSVSSAEWAQLLGLFSLMSEKSWLEQSWYFKHLSKIINGAMVFECGEAEHAVSIVEDYWLVFLKESNNNKRLSDPEKSGIETTIEKYNKAAKDMVFIQSIKHDSLAKAGITTNPYGVAKTGLSSFYIDRNETIIDENTSWMGVSHDKALKYATRMGKDLPTNIEWEIAAGWDFASSRILDYPWGNVWINEPNDESPSGCKSMAGGFPEWVKNDNVNGDEYLVKGAGWRYGKWNRNAAKVHSSHGTLIGAGVWFRCVIRTFPRVDGIGEYRPSQD